MGMKITEDDLSGEEVVNFLKEHISEMKSVSPPESKHALDVDSLQEPSVTFWTVQEERALVGCGALKALDGGHGELKSMRTSKAHRGRGVASILLRHILNECRRRNYRRVSLETGSMPFFLPARSLYRTFGFTECAPFSDYKPDPNSVFLTLELTTTPQPVSTPKRRRARRFS